MRGRAVALTVALAATLSVGGHSYAGAQVALQAGGPTSVSGTDASAVFTIGDRTVRQVRYADRGRLVYRFELTNAGTLPLRIDDIVTPDREATLLRPMQLRNAETDREVFGIGPGDTVPVELVSLMTDCERLSARAGSFVTELDLGVTVGSAVHETVTVQLPEQLHTGSAREASCPLSTSSSRPPG